MKNYPNIDATAHRPSSYPSRYDKYYTGYSSTGDVVRIYNAGNGWEMVWGNSQSNEAKGKMGERAGKSRTYRTLQELSDTLATLA